ncbi:MAG: sigma 54-interacting transcriptional regulator [Candidatus Scalindua sp.]|nr:sigma 54-interacting transcriptional regulator [Candidatus Scalindua sp.]
MEKWNKVINSHVVKIFRNIARDWWGLDTHFYVEFGNCQFNDSQIQNPLCSLIHSNKKAAEGCIVFRTHNLKASNGSQKTFVCKHCENMKIFSVPLIVMGNCFGYLVCSGMQLQLTNDQREESIRRMTSLGLSKTEVLNRYDKIRISDSHTEEYVLRLMKMVAKDVSSFCETLFNEDNIIKKQTLLIDRRRNGKYKGIIGISMSMEKIFDKLDLIEYSESPVLILGETGTGKELIATAVHYNSIRKDKAFVIQNCSSFSDTILSSELFGHEKGAFTGAVTEKKGLFEMADGGTLFLDEIGDLSIDVQGKLLRVLENGTFYRVGGVKEREVDVRVITATNKDLSEMVEAGLFRRDLLFRINTLRIVLPPLRRRREDIEPLFFSFLEYYTDKKNIGGKRLSPDLIKIINEHDWPGNVRELKNTVESLVTMSRRSPTLEPEHLYLEATKAVFKEPSISGDNESKKLQDVISTADKEMTGFMLQKEKWNKTRAARELGISRASLNRRIEKYNIYKKAIS